MYLFASQLVPFAADDVLSGQARHSGDHARGQSELAELRYHRMWERLSVIVGYRSRRRARSIVEISPIRANSVRKNDSNHSKVSGGGHEVKKRPTCPCKRRAWKPSQWRNGTGFQKVKRTGTKYVP